MNTNETAPNPENLGLAVYGKPWVSGGTTAAIFAFAGTTRGSSSAIDIGIDLRGKLPDLFDASNHIANTTDTMMFVGAAAVIGLARTSLSTEAAFKARRRKAIAAIGVSTVALNAFGEWVLPQDRFTADPVDFLYGCFGGVLAYALAKQKFVSPADFDNLAAKLPEHTKERQFYDDKQQLIVAQRPTNQPKPPKADRRPRGTKPGGTRRHHNQHPSRKRR